MKLYRQPRTCDAFTLIEMVGVLAVIAILAAMLVPKVFVAINESRYANAVSSCNTIKTATVGYFATEGRLSTSNTATYDQVLLSEGLLERPFTARVGTGWYVTCTNVGTASQFYLDGTTNSALIGNRVVQVVFLGVSGNEAWELSKRIDGDLLSAANSTTADAKGRVEYAAPSSGLTDVRVYIADN